MQRSEGRSEVATRHRSGDQQKSDSNTERGSRRVQDQRLERPDQQIASREETLGVQNRSIGWLCQQVSRQRVLQPI